MTAVFIGLGANLADPLRQLQLAAGALRQLPATNLVKLSSFYRSRPMGPQDQPDYVNAVAQLETRLTAEQLLNALQQIEQTQGRQRKAERWGARTLDLDILLFGQQVIQTPRLTVPHYGLHLREFVIYPLLEIAEDLTIPGLGPLVTLAQQVPRNGLTMLVSSNIADIS